MENNNFEQQPQQPQQETQQPQQEYQQQQPQQPYQPKSKMAAGVLGILLGSFGVHNFYLGFTGKAAAQLLITVCTCGVGAIVSSIWGLIEGILILTAEQSFDAHGVKLV